MLLLTQPGILIFCTFSFNSVPAGLCHQISKQVFLVLSLYTSDVNLQVSLLRCIRHSVDGFEQVSSVDCSGTKGVNFGVSLHAVTLVIFS